MSDEQVKRSSRGKNNRRKGANLERDMCNIFRQYGFQADRTAPMQARNGNQQEEKNYPDVIVYGAWVDKADFLIECKNWKQYTARKIWEWMEANAAHAVVFKVDRKRPLVAIEPEMLAKLIAGYHKE